jgi:hypothetical protein
MEGGEMMSHLIALVGLCKSHTYTYVKKLTDAEVDELLCEMKYIKLLPDPEDRYSSEPTLQLPELMVMDAGDLRNIILLSGRLPECDRDYYVHKWHVAEREFGSLLLDTMSIGGTGYGWSEEKLWNLCQDTAHIFMADIH